MPVQKNKELEKIRKSFGLTIKEFSARLGIPLGTYKKYEYNERPQPFWLSTIIEKFKYDSLIKNKKIDSLAEYLIFILIANNWDLHDIQKFIKQLQKKILP
jgi:transcriptional regulator with XRE-family HTH domain